MTGVTIREDMVDDRLPSLRDPATFKLLILLRDGRVGRVGRVPSSKRMR